jgi:hypothetical protein
MEDTLKVKCVHVQSTNCIGLIIDEGVDPNGQKWYRTDCDGVRGEWELSPLLTKEDVIKCEEQFKAQIAPSTRKVILNIMGTVETPKKSKSASKVLQLMDADYSYSEALSRTLKEDKEIRKKELEKELETYI